MSLLERTFPKKPQIQTLTFISKPRAFSGPASSGFPVEKPPVVVQVHVTGAPGGTSGYGMFWRQLTQSRGEAVYFHSGDFPKRGT